MTIAFGQGLNVCAAPGADGRRRTGHGGTMINPTFLKRGEAAAKLNAPRIIKPETSESLRYLMRLNAQVGTAKNANIDGYFAGGKTGTADKIFHGHYSHDKVLTTFMAIVPADKPKYLFFVMLDEPQAIPGTYGFHTAAWNSGAVAGKVITRVGPLLGLEPRFTPPTPAISPTCPARLYRCEFRGRAWEPLMRLGDLLPEVALAAGSAAREIAGLSADSRAVGENFVFFALSGSKADGAVFAAQAVARGAVAVVGQHKVDVAPAIFIEVSDARRSLALAAACFYQQQPETIVAITGTSGKKLGCGLHAANLARARLSCRFARHDRPRGAIRRSLWLIDDARSGLAA